MNANTAAKKHATATAATRKVQRLTAVMDRFHALRVMVLPAEDGETGNLRNGAFWCRFKTQQALVRARRTATPRWAAVTG